MGKSIEELGREYIAEAAVLDKRAAEIEAMVASTAGEESRLEYRVRAARLRRMATKARQQGYELIHYRDKKEGKV